MDHVMVTAGQPHSGRLADMDYAHTREVLDEHLIPTLEVAHNAAGFVDTPLSASLLVDQLDKRRSQLRVTLPIGPSGGLTSS
jgi:hypothetical protein